MLARRNLGDAIFGRKSEIATLNVFLRPGEGPRALVLEGEPGIGKTTLWQAAVEDARTRGLQVLASSPVSVERQLSFAALADLLTDRLDAVASRLPLPQRRALEIALLLEDPAGGTAERRTVAAATLSALRELCGADPLLLAVDDVQWLDEPSAAALSFAMRRLGDAPVSVLAARRVEPSSPAPTDLETAIERRHGADLTRVRLGPLSIEALHAAIQDRLGAAFPHWVLEQLHQTSRGNPFYAFELSLALLRRGETLERGHSLPVPETLQGLVRERIDALPPDVRDVLPVVAALSDPTTEVVEASGVGGAIDEAIRAGVLELGRGGRLRFTHPLLASGAYARLGPREQAALHRRLASVVPGEEHARHLALGATGPSAEVAAEVHGAARQAAGRGAIGAAAGLAEHAVRLTPSERTAELFERRLDASAYEMRGGDTARARHHLESLLDSSVPAPIRAAALLRLARLGEQSPGQGLEMCREAIEQAGTDSLSAEAHQLAAEMSMLSGDVPGAQDHAAKAADLAERAGEPAVLIESLGTLCHYQTYTGTITPGLLERAVELERGAARPSNNYSPREILGLRLMYADRLDEARELLEASLAAAADLGDELDRNSLLIHLTQLECRAGRLARAFERAHEAHAVSEQAGQWAPSAPLFAVALAAAHVGDVTEARQAGESGLAMAETSGSRVFGALNRWALGFLELSLDDAAAADRHLRELPGELDAMGYRNPGVRPVYADAIEARIGVGDLDGGVQVLIDDLERRGRNLDIPWARAAAARCRGLLVAARGDQDSAVPELERALEEHRRSPQPLERGRTLLALGNTLRRGKRRATARDRLTQALELFDNLGAPLWAERAASELARIPGRPPGSGELSETERRIAGLVAEGLSNKEIAARLFVTVRTVEANLSKVFQKVGVRSRAELAGRLGRRRDA